MASPDIEMCFAYSTVYCSIVKFVYSKKATQFGEFSYYFWLTQHTEDKSKVEISQSFAAFSEYINFKEFSSNPLHKKDIRKFFNNSL